MVRGLAIVALIALVVVVLWLEPTSRDRWAAADRVLPRGRVLPLPGVARAAGRLEAWSDRNRRVFYGAIAVAVVDIGAADRLAAERGRCGRLLRRAGACAYAVWRVWRDEHSYAGEPAPKRRDAAPSSASSAAGSRPACPDEDGRVALGPAGRLGLAQRHHQVHEVGRLLALERRHELLVVDARTSRSYGS